MDVTLTTARLVLRQPVMSDAERIARFLDNFAVSGNLSRVPYPIASPMPRAGSGPGGRIPRRARPASPSSCPARD